MWGDVMDDLLFNAGLADEAYASLREVAEATMQKAAGAATCSKRKVLLLDKGSLKAAHCRVTGNARADDPAANDEHVHWSLL
jgi:hypothetical protein